MAVITSLQYLSSDGKIKTLSLTNDSINVGDLQIGGVALSAAAFAALIGVDSGAFTVITGSDVQALFANVDSKIIVKDGSVAFTGDQSMGGFKLTDLADPTVADDAATKQYVDNVAQGLKPKSAVRVASVANLDIATDLEDGDSLDGITLATGDRVLLKDQTSAFDNGIYIVAASGAASRSTDFDSLSPIDEINGAYVAVQEGTANAGKVFVQTGVVTSIGVSDINFVFFNSAATVIGGDMITVSSSVISVDLATVSGLESTNPGNNNGQLRNKLEASNPTLQIDGSNQLGVKFGTSSGLETSASGLKIKPDVTTTNTLALTLTTDGAGTKYDPNSFTESTEALALAAGVAGDGISLTTGVLAVDHDGQGLQFTTNQLALELDGSTLSKSASGVKVADAGITATQLAASVAGAGLTGGAGTALAVGAGNGIQVNADSVDVLFSPSVKKSMVAGESFAANTSFLVRMALTGETAGRVYKASVDATSIDGFYAFGIAFSAAGVAAAGAIDVTLLATHALGASDSPFSAGDIGKPVFLSGTAGQFSITAPTTDNFAVCRVGVVQTTTSIMFKDFQLIAIYSA